MYLHKILEYSKGYVFLGEDKNGSVTENQSRDVVFLEEDFPGRGEIDRDLHFYEMEDPEVGEDVRMIDSILTRLDNIESQTLLGASGSNNLIDYVPMEQDHEQSQPQRSNSERILCRRFEIEGEAFMISHVEEEPKTKQQALSAPNAKKWFEAMEEEMNSMKSNTVWDLVDLLPCRKIVGNKWVLNIKRKAYGTIDRYKARLVAKGYTQQEGIDYEETFSHVVRFVSIRLILAIVERMDLELYQIDVKTSFLNEELDEEIYMDQPLGFKLKGQECKVCKLKRSIYGLK